MMVEKVRCHAVRRMGYSVGSGKQRFRGKRKQEHRWLEWRGHHVLNLRVDKIHLLKRMTPPLREIQKLQKGRVSEPVADF
jgi:hypothetical protein